jgi:hypothetical protein
MLGLNAARVQSFLDRVRSDRDGSPEMYSILALFGRKCGGILCTLDDESMAWVTWTDENDLGYDVTVLISFPWSELDDLVRLSHAKRAVVADIEPAYVAHRLRQIRRRMLMRTLRYHLMEWACRPGGPLAEMVRRSWKRRRLDLPH